ncbi:DUF58 domain-containing protein [Planctomicrobium sp. SH668]|uniref:DUF58 domain-containing protein n=1 Tax=Planctomicrobium sp. SH668 TaxID=3448126 RepID=UPI003F5BA9E7
MAQSSSSETGNYPAPSFIDVATLMEIQSLELRAKAIVEGLFSGLHRSPYHGFSVEFTEYRQYVNGDDLRFLDWKLFARSDRYYVKRFEDETNQLCHILLDNSKSMSYGSLTYSKSDYAKTLAGTIAYFLNQQRDAVGLYRFSSQLDELIPPRYRVGHLRRIINSLEQQPEGNSTGLSEALEQVADLVSKRGLFVLVSDLLAPLDELETRISYLRARRSEMVLFQILDPTEIHFTFDQATLFVDVETGQEIYVDPVVAKENYRSQFQKHQDGVVRICERLGVHLHVVSSEAPMEQVLFNFLKSRNNVQPVSRH